jgi:hypothetical protein
MRIHPRCAAARERARHAAGHGRPAPGVPAYQQRKGSDMTGTRCTCGFTEAGSAYGTLPGTANAHTPLLANPGKCAFAHVRK